MHKIFGTKLDGEYYTRKGAYLIPVNGEKLGVVKTPKGFFLLGGGIEGQETDEECIARECLEEAGFTVQIGKKLCSAEAYVEHSTIGLFHPVQVYYTGGLIARTREGTESDHEFMWLPYESIRRKMFSTMHNWALEQAWKEKTESIVQDALCRFGMDNCEVRPVPGHEGGRNDLFVLTKPDGERYVLRLSTLPDRTEEDYLAETEFVRYLAANGASVADVLTSKNGKLVERINGTFASVFEYAPGMLISDNGYRYREGSPLAEYFYNTGKTLGKIHALSKQYRSVHHRADYFDKYNRVYIDNLISDTYADLKDAIFARLDAFCTLPRDETAYGLVHFDFSDGNYHINMDTGAITVFDFDNAMTCWYMFDLANLWTHGVGWCQFEEAPSVRRAFMTEYFGTVLAGYRSEAELPEELLDKLPLFIDMVLIENIVDEFECCRRAGEEVEYEDIEDAAESLVRNLPWAGFFEE